MAQSEVTRKRRSAAQWRALLERQAASGQSVEAFCRSESMSPASFYRWRRLLLETMGDTETASPPVSEPAFLDLGTLGGGRRRWDLELDLGAGIVLRLRGG